MLSFEEQLALLATEGNPKRKQSRSFMNSSSTIRTAIREEEEDDDKDKRTSFRRQYAQFDTTTKNTQPSRKPINKSSSSFKRQDKHAPTEMSSKKPVSRSREAIHVEKPTKKILDPRFNPLTGYLNEGLYKKAYGFIDDMEQQEIVELRKQIAKEKNPEQLEKLKKLLQTFESKRQTMKKKEKTKEVKRKWKKVELEAVKDGKKPFYLKKSEFKRLELVDKYKNMDKKSIDKLLEKKRKRNAAEERKFIPKKRMD